MTTRQTTTANGAGKDRPKATRGAKARDTNGAHAKANGSRAKAGNGKVGNGSPVSSRGEVEQLVEVLKAVKQGDFAVRFPHAEGRHPGPRRRAAQRHHRHERAHDRRARARRQGRRPGRQDARARVGRPGEGLVGERACPSVNQLIADLVAPTNEVARVITAVARGDLSQKMVLEIEGRPVRGEFLRIGTTVNAMVDQLNSFAAEVTRVAKEVGNEGKLGGQADVKGVSRHVEGPDRQRQRPRREPHRAGAQHREGDDRRRQGRPVAEDHRRREGRDPRAEEHDQRHGRSALLVRRGGHARREGSRHRGQARRPGRRQGRVGHVEGPDRQRQRPRRQPHGPGAQHREGDDGRRQRRPFAEDHGRRARRDLRAEEHHQHDGRHAALVRGRGDARREGSRHRGQARRAGRRQGRVRHVEGPDRQRQRPGGEPHRAGARHRRRSRPPSRAAT